MSTRRSAAAPARRHRAFGGEQILIESFPETEPDARTPLLDLLGLSARQGLARVVLENAIRRHNAAVCTMLGLDPFAFTLACVPFDVYVRLAERHGWGKQSIWTHFDGYQVSDALDFHALVGGDVRYGGSADWCTVGSRYDSNHLTVRFAVLQWARFR